MTGNVMAIKLAELWPEMIVALGAVACLATGLAPQAAVRRATAWVAAAALVLGAAVPMLLNRGEPGPETVPLVLGLAGTPLAAFVKLAVVGMGLLLLLQAAGVPTSLRQSLDVEAPGAKFDPAHVIRGEFFAFFLMSLVGVMLCAGASDLVWLFLALELTSLPTYVMVATSRDRVEAQEASVKYFFLGALAAAVFLYGFALIYGSTGATDFASIHAAVLAQVATAGAPAPLFVIGMVLAVVGIAFKIAAFPMHYYAADVYQGAATPVTAFLAFVPKTAGFVSIILVLGLSSSPLPLTVSYLLWIMAALTMTVGNVMGLLQTSVKRVLGYSSIAHSGYMLVGVLAYTRGLGPETDALGNGVAAVLFYLIAYGLGNLAALAVLGCLQRDGEEADSFDDLSGLSRRHPGLAALMLLSMLSLIGLPPMVGFIGKIYLFGSAISRSTDDLNLVWLVVVAVLNSAVSAVYYLRIAAACYFGDEARSVTALPAPGPRLAATIASAAAIALGVAGGQLVNLTREAGTPVAKAPVLTEEAPAQTSADAQPRF